jgi:hypothetical protein
MAKANKRPVRRRRDTKQFVGTCSNCRKKKEVVKVKNNQVCDSCLSGHYE